MSMISELHTLRRIVARLQQKLPGLLAASCRHVHDKPHRRCRQEEDYVRCSGHTGKPRCRLSDLVDAYRRYGHLQAALDPLNLRNSRRNVSADNTSAIIKQYMAESAIEYGVHMARSILTNPIHPAHENFAQCLSLSMSTRDMSELKPEVYGLSAEAPLEAGHDKVIGYICAADGAKNVGEMTAHLQQMYCGPVSAEFMHLESATERHWFAEQYESTVLRKLDSKEQLKLAEILLKSQHFDQFLARKFPSVRRYGGEGAESMMAFFHTVFATSPAQRVRQIVIAMPHRGRLNVLVTMLNFPAAAIFQKMKGTLHPSEGYGDVLSHFVTSTDLTFPDGSVHVTMVPNPSHLELSNPVAVGKTRARQLSLGIGDYAREGTSRDELDEAICIQVHGDASLPGQGVIAETLSFSRVPHFRVGGSIHLVVNNQVGFTTYPEEGRSSTHCTDLAKCVDVPVLHVNGDYPELVKTVTDVAMRYRKTFRKDVFVDLVCFRKHGHNEMDDPTFTNPVMYNAIKSRKSIPDSYVECLQAKNILSEADVDQWVSKWNETYSKKMASLETYQFTVDHLQKQWKCCTRAPTITQVVDTGEDIDLLKFIGVRSVAAKADMTLHPRLSKVHCEPRIRNVTAGNHIDWSTAEALAVGSLLLKGFSVRISGQDVARGTFSHRHAVFYDQTNDRPFIPLNHMKPDQKQFFEVANSILSEEAVLAFEYGFSTEHPNHLTIWEAQFGDFANVAQTVIDTYIAGGEAKWQRQSSLVMLLPHGLEGMGPEHSSCRVERYLQLCDSHECSVDGDDRNFCVAYPTTPAQYFHLLRRQMLRHYRKPLIIAAPKSLLRLPAAVSRLEDMRPGTSFQPVLIGSVNSANSVNTADVTPAFVLLSVDFSNTKTYTAVTNFDHELIFCSGKHYYGLEDYRSSKNLDEFAIIRLEALCPFPTQALTDVVSGFKNAQSFVWSQEEPRNMGPWSFVRPRFENLLNIKLKYIGRKEMPIPDVGIKKVYDQLHQAVIATTFET